jgi:hypothetical protein
VRAFYAARGFSKGPGDVFKDAYGPGDDLVAFRKAQVSWRGLAGGVV